MSGYRYGDGNPIDLVVLCRRDPGWAANVITKMAEDAKALGVYYRRVVAVATLLGEHGCDCDCSCPECREYPLPDDERCLACRIGDVLKGNP